MSNLRNTALGASSPAKPALHIPELPSVSASYPNSHLIVSAARQAIGGDVDGMTSRQLPPKLASHGAAVGERGVEV